MGKHVLCVPSSKPFASPCPAVRTHELKVQAMRSSTWMSHSSRLRSFAGRGGEGEEKKKRGSLFPFARGGKKIPQFFDADFLSPEARRRIFLPERRGIWGLAHVSAIPLTLFSPPLPLATLLRLELEYHMWYMGGRGRVSWNFTYE